jgi:hypothetical protein
MMVKAGAEGSGKRASHYRDVPNGVFSDEIDMLGVRKILVGWTSPRVGNYVLSGKIRRKANGKRGKATAYVYSRADVVALAKVMREQGKLIVTRKAKAPSKAKLKEQIKDVNRTLSDQQPMMTFFQTMVERFRQTEPTIAMIRIDFVSGEIQVERRQTERLSVGGRR